MISVSAFNKPVFLLPCPPAGKAEARICRKITWDRICILLSKGLFRKAGAAEAVKEISPDIDPRLLGMIGCEKFLRSYKEAVENFIEDNMNVYKVPYKADFEGNDTEIKLHFFTYGERLVHEHSGLSFTEINELDYLDYRMLLADAAKIKILRRKDGKGVEYLNECYDCMHRISDIFS